ncbi:hypothetical protein ABT218_11125 [Streptomyces sp. NPDC001455]|uniref:hypothetical protein n=1 Tax=Streptomyces sp. NPDC001455 TaxID=3154518 RepID=UPI0033216BB4
MADTVGDPGEAVDQSHGMSDVLDVRRRVDDLQQDAVAVADQVVPAAGLATVDR